MTPNVASEYLRALHEVSTRVQVSDAFGRAVPFDEGVSRGVELLRSLRTNNKKVLLIGNGGSAAIAAHMQVDLCNAGGLRALVFNDVPVLTATSNDFGYETVFERPSQLWIDDGDALIAVSSSGHSENIVRAARTCAQDTCHVITMSGFDPGNRLRTSGHLNFYVPSSSYGLVELAHGALAHIITDFLASGDVATTAEPATTTLAIGRTG